MRLFRVGYDASSANQKTPNSCVVTKMTALLEVSNLRTRLNDGQQMLSVVDGLDLTIDKGETVALVGESGSGKSMTALSIMQLLPDPRAVIEGEVRFEGRNLLTLTDRQMRLLRGNELAMIFQDPMTALNPVLTIGTQMTEGLRFHLKLNKKEAVQMAVEWLKRVGISRAEDIIDEYPHQLSGGMCQRVMIAMAMSCEPKLLVADEPTTALDVTIQAQIMDLMQTIRRTWDTSILLITHDLAVVHEIADRVVVMYAGQAVESAPAEDLFQKPLHPYTEGLLGAIPSWETETDRLPVIEGSVPSPGHMHTGCRFAPRCAFAAERCDRQEPQLKELKANHHVRCFLHENKG